MAASPSEIAGLGKDIDFYVGKSEVEKGGPGSGHHHHKGRKGKRGGSAPSRGKWQSARSVTELDEAKEWGQENFAGWESSLTSGEKEALFSYAQAGAEGGATSYLLNANLRGQLDTPESKEIASRLTAGIDDAIAKGALPEDTVLWRGANRQGIWANPESLVGKTITDKGFVSTSLLEDRAGGFAASAERHGEGALMVQVRAPKGTPVAYLEDMQTTSSGKRPSEYEALLGRGTSFKVVQYSPPKEPYFLMPDSERFGVLTVEVL